MERRAVPPDLAQPAEGRTVVQSDGGQQLVRLLGGEVLGALGRLPGGGHGRVGPARGQQTARVPGPGAVHGRRGGLGGPVGRGGPGVDRDRTRAGPVRRADGHVQVQGVALGQHERGLDHQLVQGARADLVARPDRQLDQGRAGRQDGAQRHVVGEPGVGGEGEAAGEQHALRVGPGDGRAEHGVVDGRQAESARVGGGPGGGLQPVAAALERVGGKGEPRAVPAAEQGGPVDGVALDVDPGERRQRRPLLGPLPAQDRDGGDGLVQAGADEAREGAVGAEFDEGRRALGGQGGHHVGEAHGPADLSHPVLRVGDLLRTRHQAGDVGDHRDLGVPEGQGLCDGEELVQHAVHVGRVERVADPKAAGTAVREVLPHALDGRLVTRNHHRTGPVDGRDVHAVDEDGPDLLLRRLQRHHRPTTRQRLHQPRTGTHQHRRVLQRQHPRHMRRRQLTDRMARDEVRPHTPRLEQPEQRHLHREQRRLRPTRLVQPLTRGDHLAQRQPQRPRHRIESLGEHRLGSVQLTPHTDPLGTLPREQERQTARTRHPAHHIRTLRITQRRRITQHHRPLLQRRPAHGQRLGEVHRIGGEGQLGHTSALFAQRLGRTRRHDERQQRSVHRRPGNLDRRGLLHRGLLDDDMGVGAGDTERGHRGAARTLQRRPLPLLGQQLHRARRPVHVRRRLVHVQRARQHTVPDRQHRLDHTRHTGRGLGVTDVRLHRTQPQRLFGRTLLPVGRDQRLRLDRVAQPGAGAVRLDHVHVRGGEPGGVERRPDHPLLRSAAGGGELAGAAVLVDGGAAQQGEHPVAVAAGVGEPLQDQQTGALAPAGAVGGGGEGLAAAVGGQAALAAELDEHARRGEHGGAAGQGERALAGAQRAGGEVERDQRGGAGGVDGHRRALQAEGVGDPAGGDGGGGAGQDVAVGLLGGQVVHARPVLLGDDAREHAGAGTAQGRRVDRGVLQGLPGGLQEQALLGLGGERLAGRDAEEVGVELARVVEESALAGVAAAGPVGVGVVEVVEVPAPVGGEGADDVALLGDQPPQLVGGVGAAGEAAGHADDGDRLLRPGPAVGGGVGDGGAGLRVAQAAAGLVQLGGNLVEVVAQLLLVGAHICGASLRKCRARCR